MTWKEQPETTEANQVYLSPFVLNTNMITVDVTKLYVQDPKLHAPDIPRRNVFQALAAGVGSGIQVCLESDFPEVKRTSESLTIYYSLP